ncbi:peptidylprolyl isomerase [Flavisolibacter ginsengisoli]|uniref:Peptidyl-prolyl cis-trans isomerase SurA n=1 Tax=Flavisolibacter ginsengisoli DSM 18119 TaxID=1121884 RepID=A0A1M4ZS87_9BACT|nr:peptidylprolyl isomerase [Flavisolibacter ginsengisoli]SHF20950.1 peptidyl-prolyl cis-trans isomerase SurA [Flavisolibacter ginsengisoli DSM 18119]
MKKLIAFALLWASFSASAQTLFHYGKDSVSVNEFLKAYQKNNTGVRTEKAFMEYLDLYIASRLKIAEARSKGYDTLPQIVSDLESLRQQILPSYLTDKESTQKLVREAFTRAQKEIHLAHIFIAAKGSDTLDALKTIAELQAELKKGKPFAELAQKYSDDPSAKTNGGDIGFITVFNLPYELENLAYTTPVGKVSKLYRSRAGYHIFKNLGERKAIGRMKAAEILLAFPPEANDSAKTAVKKLADSLYNRILKGDDFGKLAAQFSNDIVSAASNGQMQEFGTGDYDPVFEKTVFALSKDGDVTPPFTTPYGYHIVKRIGKIAIPSQPTATALAEMQAKVEQSDRINTTKSLLAKKIMKDARFKKAAFENTQLWAYSDSVFNHQSPKTALHLTNASVLFTVGKQNVTVNDWINYAQNFRFRADGSGIKPYAQVMDEFIDASALDYYQRHLEDYNEEFRQQINEFRDGNLFFEIMQREVWGPAQNDSAALVSYYNAHKNKYNWKQSADAVIFYANDLTSATELSTELKKDPAQWRTLVSERSEKIAADSSRFELEQLPNPSHLSLTPGTITAPLVNKSDNTASFAYILKYYPQAEPRNFADAKGLVITDYQAQLEKDWLDKLKKKYPVVMNQKALEELKRNKKY